MMVGDPLEKFRRKNVPGTAERPESQAEPRPQSGVRKPYVAHEGKDRGLSLDIRRVLGPTHSPAYRYLYNISYDYDYFTNFVLEFGFMTVKVRGKNLHDIVAAIKRHTCEYIQDFHPDEHELPGEAEPLIESIVIERPDGRGQESENTGVVSSLS